MYYSTVPYTANLLSKSVKLLSETGNTETDNVCTVINVQGKIVTLPVCTPLFR